MSVHPVVLLLVLVPLGGVLICALASFDRLLWNQHEFHRESWIADGKPPGFFWRPPGADPLTGQFAKMQLSFAYLFKTPGWISGSKETMKLLKRFRYSVLIWNVGVITLFVVFVNLM